MKADRAVYAKRSLLYGGLDKLVSILMPYLVKMVLIRRLGAEYLGLDSFFVSLLQVLNLSELGFSGAILSSLYKPMATGDEKSISGIYTYYRDVYRIIGLAILGVGALLAPFLPGMIRGSIPSAGNLYRFYLIYLLNAVFSYFFFSYKQTLLLAGQRRDIISCIDMAARLFLYVLQIILLLKTDSFLLYVLALPAMTLIQGVGSSIAIRSLYPGLTDREKIMPEQKRVIQQNVKGAFVNRLCNASRNMFDSVFISMFVGLTATARYANYYYVLHAAVGFSAVFVNAMEAGIGNSVASETEDKNYQDMLRLVFLYMWMAGIMTTCLLCLYQRFILLSFGEEMLLPTGMMIVFCVYFYVLMMGDVRYLYVKAAGIWWESRIQAITEACANIILNFVLGKLFGIYGILFATLITLFILNFLWSTHLIYRHYFFSHTPVRFFRDHLFYGLITLVVCAITSLAVSYIAIDGIPGFVVSLILCAAISSVLSFLIYKKCHIYRDAMSWMLGVTKWDRFTLIRNFFI